MLYNLISGQSDNVLVNCFLCENKEKALFWPVTQRDLSEVTFRCCIYMIKRARTLCSNACTGKENPKQLTEKNPR